MTDIDKKFPPERKHEFLNWVMVTQDRNDWCSFVLEYMDNHQLKNWYEGADFAVKWAQECPSRVAVMLAQDRLVEPSWAMKVIENAKIGFPSTAAYTMAKSNLAPMTWAMGIIENTELGKPYVIAEHMTQMGHAPEKWANKLLDKYHFKHTCKGR